MLPLLTSWKPGPLKHPVVLAALVLPLALALALAWGFELTRTLGAHRRLQRHGDALALSLATLEAQALNDFATSNRTIAAAYVAMNHAHLSRAGALTLGDSPQDAPTSPPRLVETLGQLMDTAHASQCARFAVTLGAVRKGASRGLNPLNERPGNEPMGLAQTIGLTNAAEFSRALEGRPCGDPRPLPEPGCMERGSCFMRFRADSASGDALTPPRVYTCVACGPQASGDDEEAALFMASTDYQPQEPGRKFPDLFAPFWRARLPTKSFPEIGGLLPSEEER